ncbi:MAG: hypothetical protein COB02_08025 [Candidatus Cloacimonadota bacterium]|nr:MAG: hypothetical protein COB02_08025 [Candidatus Cloacimonadota bacterium]
MKKKVRLHNNLKGFVFPLVLVLAVITLVGMTSVLFFAQSESKLTNKFVDYMLAERIADSGVEQALFYLKSDKDLNAQLIDLMRSNSDGELTIPDILKTEVAMLGNGHGTNSLEIEVNYIYTPPPFDDGGVYTGDVQILSTGIYTNSLHQTVKRQIEAIYGVRALYLGIVAPKHALFVREDENLNYNFEDDIDPSELKVLNGDVFIENGITAELSDYLLRKLIDKNELTYDEYYYIDHPPTSYGLDKGGIDFLDAGQIEYEKNGIFRKFNVFGRPVKEKYAQNVHRSYGYYNDKVIKLRGLEFYKSMAKLTLEPRKYSRQGKTSHDKYFKDIIFEGENGLNTAKYNKVLPLYGYGDWRNAPVVDPNRYGPRSRAYDMSRPINIDGISFIRGDVFIEGWYEGLGILVVQGNVYLGGSVKALDKDQTGHPSLLNIIVYEDPQREGGYTATNHASFKKTGHVILKPHDDNDWSEGGGEKANTNVKIDPSIYTQNGLQMDKDAFRDNNYDLGSFDMSFKHNFVTDTVNMNFLPHDLIIYGKNPDDEFRNGDVNGLEDFLQAEFNVVMKSWVVKTITDNTIN